MKMELHRVQEGIIETSTGKLKYCRLKSGATVTVYGRELLSKSVASLESLLRRELYLNDTEAKEVAAEIWAVKP